MAAPKCVGSLRQFQEVCRRHDRVWILLNREKFRSRGKNLRWEYPGARFELFVREELRTAASHLSLVGLPVGRPSRPADAVPRRECVSRIRAASRPARPAQIASTPRKNAKPRVTNARRPGHCALPNSILLSAALPAATGRELQSRVQVSTPDQHESRGAHERHRFY